MKRDNELQKPLHILVFDLKKGNRLLWKSMMHKSQKLVHQIKISKISGIDLKKRCKDKKWSNVMNCKEVKWKVSKVT